MQVTTIAGPKGGCGKSTVTTLLAVRATHESGKVALIDLNEDQGTLSDWWVLRGRPANPFLYGDEGTLDELVNGLRAAGWTHVFIDGPPYDQDLIEMSVFVADRVIIPVKLAYFDASAIDSVIGICQRRKKPYAFLINEFDGRQMFANANAVPLEMLKGRGQILDTRFSYHPKHRLGQIEGKTGAEIDKSLAREVESAWLEIAKLGRGTAPLKAIEGGRHD